MARRKLVFANNPLLSGPALVDRERGGIPYRELQVSSIHPDPNQPRTSFDEEKLKELAHSIRTYGILSPILVKPIAAKAGEYTLISGERRLRAAQLAGLSTVPAVIDQDGDKSEDTTLAIQLVENLQRADLSPLERSQALGLLRERYALSVREIADKLGISKSMVQRSLDILTLPDDLLNALREGASESKVLLLAKIEDIEIRASYLKDLEVMTRAQIEKDLDRNKSSVKGEGSHPLSAEDQRITDEIQRALGLKVRMTRSQPGADSGRLLIDFYSSADLQEIFRKLVSES